MCFFTSEGMNNLQRFLQDLNCSFGSGGVNAWFQSKELPEFLHQLNTSHNLPVKTAARVVGRQPESETWVLSPELQIDSDGEVISPDEAPYYWIPPDIAELSKVKVHIPSRDLCPDIKRPLLDDPKATLCRLMTLLSVCLKHNFTQALVVLGATLQTFHFEKVVQLFRGCPICVCVGPPETGKTTAILAALSLCGSTESSYYVKGTNAFFLQRSAECTLPYGIDDPQNSSRSTSKTNRLDLPEMIVDLYNAGKSANMIKGSKKPKSAPLIASNYDLNHEESLVVIVCTLFVHRCNTFGAEIMVYLFQIPVADYYRPICQPTCGPTECI